MGAEFWLDEQGYFVVLHVCGGAGEERMQVFPRLWLEAHWEWCDGWYMCVHGRVILLVFSEQYVWCLHVDWRGVRVLPPVMPGGVP
jgi:hypothetical protein